MRSTARVEMTAPIPQPLRVLMVEDNPADAELCIRELKKAGFDARVDVVQTAQEFSARLADGEYQLVIADYTLPTWSGMEALDLLRRKFKDMPLIVLTGTLKEEESADCLRRGADDCVHKDRLARIGPAVRVALDRRATAAEYARLQEQCSKLQERREHLAKPLESSLQADSHLGRAEACTPTIGEHLAKSSSTEGANAGRDGASLAAFAELNPNPVLEFLSDGKLGCFNKSASEMAQSLGKDHPFAMLPPDSAAIIRTCLATGQKKLRIETSMGGRTFSWSFYPVKQNQVVHCYVGDITERRQLEDQLRHSQKLESVGSSLVFNRSVGLKDAWAKAQIQGKNNLFLH